ncbi:uncharacterized protein LOC132257984 [Phlebotomus argentipes]|uniref:uncharacterized protein LOC132257984 n=1 Tax=Phlebotomus argentipes TaxID=94469 RepID=UPI0028930AE6|nr:uncharacterized protein LOC132257984 [Phlebotomus argentipes]
MINSLVTLVVLFLLLSSAKTDGENVQDSETLSRRKRFLLIFNNGGLAKAVLGISAPVIFNDKTKRSLNMSYNFQAQYQFLPNVTSPLADPFFTGLQRRRKRQSPTRSAPDESRKYLYALLEGLMRHRGVDGEQCLLRAICEVAESPCKHNGLVGELIDLIFTPHEHEAQPEHVQARFIGLRGGNCASTYSLCPRGEGLLDAISVIM